MLLTFLKCAVDVVTRKVSRRHVIIPAITHDLSIRESLRDSPTDSRQSAASGVKEQCIDTSDLLRKSEDKEVGCHRQYSLSGGAVNSAKASTVAASEASCINSLAFCGEFVQKFVLVLGGNRRGREDQGWIKGGSGEPRSKMRASWLNFGWRWLKDKTKSAAWNQTSTCQLPSQPHTSAPLSHLQHLSLMSSLFACRLQIQRLINPDPCMNPRSL